MILFQIDYVELAKEVQKLEPQNNTEMTLWGFAMLLALISGYGLAWMIWKQYQKYQERVEKTLANVDQTMTKVTVYLEGRHNHDEKVNKMAETLVKIGERLSNISDKIDSNNNK